MTDRELMQQALDMLMDAQLHNYALKHKETDDLITALRERLAQPQRTHWEGCEEVHPECRKPEQEPVAWLYRDYYNTLKLAQTEPPPPLAFPVYTTPPCVPQQALTNVTQPIASTEQEPVQEPVAWRYRGNLHEFDPSDWAEGPVTPLYTTPPRREWQGLTNDDLKPVCDEYRILFGGWVHDFARAIEAKLKEKNG